MFVRRAVILACTMIVASGCTYRDPSIDLLEGELRWMEDQVFLLEDQLEAKSAALAACQGGACGDAQQQPSNLGAGDYEIVFGDQRTDTPDSNAGQPDAVDSTKPTPAEPQPSTPLYETIEPQVTLPPETSAQPTYEIIEPSVELPPAETNPATESPSEPQHLTPDELPSPTAPQLDQIPGAAATGMRQRIQLQSFYEESQPADEFDAHVTHIVVDGRISTGHDFDHKSTAPGLLVVIQPRNGVGEYVSLAGPLSVVVLDGNRQGSAARIARWDFDAAAARRNLRRSDQGAGIHLVLPWPDSPPDSDQLHLFVRYTTVEGRHLETDQLLADGQAADGWRVAVRSPKRTLRQQPPQQTVPLPPEATIELRPIPSATAATAVSYEAPLRTTPEMPVLRDVTKPEWKPFR